MTTTLPRIVITAGEPAGIGLDLCAMLAHHALAANVVVIADQLALLARAKALNIKLDIQSYQLGQEISVHAGNGSINILHQATATPVTVSYTHLTLPTICSV